MANETRPPLTAEAFDKMIAESAAYQALVERVSALDVTVSGLDADVQTARAESIHRDRLIEERLVSPRIRLGNRRHP